MTKRSRQPKAKRDRGAYDVALADAGCECSPPERRTCQHESNCRLIAGHYHVPRIKRTVTVRGQKYFKTGREIARDTRRADLADAARGRMVVHNDAAIKALDIPYAGAAISQDGKTVHLDIETRGVVPVLSDTHFGCPQHDLGAIIAKGNHVILVTGGDVVHRVPDVTIYDLLGAYVTARTRKRKRK